MDGVQLTKKAPLVGGRAKQRTGYESGSWAKTIGFRTAPKPLKNKGIDGGLSEFLCHNTTLGICAMLVR
jgi:hypothetical protein